MFSLLISMHIVMWVAIAAISIQVGYLDNSLNLIDRSSQQLKRLINLLAGRKVDGGEQALSPVMIPVRAVYPRAEQHFRR